MKKEAKPWKIPVKITAEDKAKLMDQVVKLRDQIKQKENDKDELKAKIKALDADVKEYEEDITNKVLIAKNGEEQRYIKCFVRKNFFNNPPVREYIDPENEEHVLWAEKLEPHEFQIVADEWVIGTPQDAPEPEDVPQGQPESESDDEGLPFDGEEEEGEGDPDNDPVEGADEES